MEGRLVENVGALEREGDYALVRNDEDQITALWMKLPRTKTQGRIVAVGFGKDGEPEWDITYKGEGKVSVSPSIDEGNGGYHGFLIDGVWSDG